MRISDWSSDVCSSDLEQPSSALTQLYSSFRKLSVGIGSPLCLRTASCHARCHPPIASPVWTSICAVGLPNGKTALARSEEHTSELQSLMRNSYAVFCLKKKKNTQETKLKS